MAAGRGQPGKGAGIRAMKKHLATVVLLLTVFAMAGVVCAGAFRVLGDIINGFGGQDWLPLWLVVGAISLGATMAFIAGTIPLGLKLLQRLE